MIDSLKNKGINHANILIFDLYKKTIERFKKNICKNPGIAQGMD